MIHIYLCEDDEQQLIHWKDIIDKYLLMNATETKLYCAIASPKELLAIRKQSDTIGLYFLDIDLNAGINGIELALEIRKYDPRGYIVFVTTHSEMALLTFRYKVEAMDFIVKDDPKTLPDQFCSCIKNAENNYRSQLDSKSHLLSIKVDKSSLVLDQNDIVAFSTGSGYHKVTIHTKNGIRQITGSLKEIKAGLNSSFCQCSRSAIVNLKHVVKYSKTESQLLMDNKETYNVSVRMSGNVQKALTNL